MPQPVVVLIEVLLEMDPGRRFQNPAELLKAMPIITGAIDTRRRITRHILQETPSAASRVGTHKPPGRLASLSRSAPAFGVSVEGLESTDRERYLDLAVFPEDQPIPERALSVLSKRREKDLLMLNA